MAAAIHLHRLDGDDDTANAEAVADAPGLHDAVLIAFARREQGLLVAPGNPLRADRHRLRSRRSARGIALRPHGAGAQLLLLSLLAPGRPRARCARNASSRPARPAPTSPRRSAPAAPIAASRPASVAQAAGLDFVPLAWERFDLVLRQRDYFLPGPQALFEFLRTAAFRERAAELTGYDIDRGRRGPPGQLRRLAAALAQRQRRLVTQVAP